MSSTRLVAHLVLTCFATLFSLRLFAQQYHPDELCKIIEAEANAHSAKIHRSTAAVLDDYDIHYHRCEWAVDPTQLYISGKVTTYFEPLASNFNLLRFHLEDVLVVDSVRYHGATATYSQGAGVLGISLPTLAAGSLDSVSIWYHGVPANSGFGSFIQSTHGSAPIVWTLSEPFGGSDWWPCKDDLTDKADSIDVLITTGNAYRGASNGLLVAERTQGNQTTYHWRHRYPIATYLICLAVTNYAQFTHQVPLPGGNLPVLNYVFPEDSAAAFGQTLDIIPLIQLYDSLFGAYPFAAEKYGHAQFGWGGGMEHQTMTFMGGYGFELQAHELAHQWFGNKITTGSWEDIWLNEGFATYCSGLAYENLLGGVYWLPFKQGHIQSVTSAPAGSVWCSDTTSVNRIFSGRLTYNKGAMILHQLRWLMGDQAFFTAIHNYINDPALTYSFARTRDLKAHLEAVYGQSLTGYFDDWFYGQGFPSYRLEYSYANGQFIGLLSQTQSHASVSFFEMEVPVRIYYNGGQDTSVRINALNNSVFATIPLNLVTIDSVRIDPDFWLISANNTTVFVSFDGIDENLLSLLRVYPVPARDRLDVDFGRVLGKTDLVLLDLQGRVVSQAQVQGQRHAVVSLSGLAPGIYGLKVTYNGRIAVRKVVVL
jgi:hypothetical protein